MKYKYNPSCIELNCTSNCCNKLGKCPTSSQNQQQSQCYYIYNEYNCYSKEDGYSNRCPSLKSNQIGQQSDSAKYVDVHVLDIVIGCSIGALALLFVICLCILRGRRSNRVAQQPQARSDVVNQSESSLQSQQDQNQVQIMLKKNSVSNISLQKIRSTMQQAVTISI